MNKNYFNTLSRVLLSTAVTLTLILIVGNICKACTSEKPRDYAFEQYCDSIWYNDRDYYHDVLVETDRYQEYLEEHGQWWEDDCPAYLEMKEHNDFKKKLLDAEDNCIKRAEYLMLMNGIQDEEYNRCKFVVDSLIATQL